MIFRKIRGFSVSTKITVMMSLMVILSSVSIGVFSYVVYRDDSIFYQGQRALATAATIATTIDVEQFKYISVTEEETEYYLRMIEVFTAANRNAGTLYLYTMVKDDDGVHYKYVFAARTEFDNPMLGGKDTIKSYGAYALRAYDYGEQVISDVYDNEGYGFLVSAFYPLFDETGNIAGLVCADIEADGVMDSIRDYKNKVILAVLVFVLLFGVISVSYSLRLFGKSKLAQQKARRLAAIVAIADAGIVIRDRKGSVAEWNIGAENILGYKQEEVIGKTAHFYAPSEEHIRIDRVDTRIAKGEHIARVEVVRKHKDGRLVNCSMSYTPIMADNGMFEGSVAIFHDITEQKQIESALNKAHSDILSSMNYSSKIQRNLLPPLSAFEQAFSDYSIVWKPRDIVGGDMFWLKNFSDGALLCVCDCTGHGTPGALITMLVVSALDTIVNETNCKDTANVIWELDQRLERALNSSVSSRDIKDGCDIAVVYVEKSGNVKFSSANIPLLVCDGKSLTRVKGQNLSVGEGEIKSKSDVNVHEIPMNCSHKFFIASDGLYEQTGGKQDLPYGHKKIAQIILDNYNGSQDFIIQKIWDAFEEYRGEVERVDDVEIIAFAVEQVKPVYTFDL